MQPFVGYHSGLYGMVGTDWLVVWYGLVSCGFGNWRKRGNRMGESPRISKSVRLGIPLCEEIPLSFVGIFELGGIFQFVHHWSGMNVEMKLVYGLCFRIFGFVGVLFK